MGDFEGVHRGNRISKRNVEEKRLLEFCDEKMCGKLMVSKEGAEESYLHLRQKILLVGDALKQSRELCYQKNSYYFMTRRSWRRVFVSCETD